MKAYKIEVLVIDTDGVEKEGVKYAIENIDYLSPQILSIKEADIGEWSNEHPLNKLKPTKETLEEYFKQNE